MLLTTLDHAAPLLTDGHFPAALAWLRDHADGAGLAAGRHEIDGDDLYSRSSKTKPPTTWRGPS